MDDVTPPAELASLPEFADLNLNHRNNLMEMYENMRARGLPAIFVRTGLQSTARLMLEQQTADTPIMETEQVRRFIQDNRGIAVSRRRRSSPRSETRQRSREALHDRLSQLVRSARAATRRHEMLRLRREMLELDQGFIRRTLGDEGDRLCTEVNDWLAKASSRLRGG